MRTAQSYHGNGDFDAFHRTSQRNEARKDFFERTHPYSNYEHHSRHGLRQPYLSRVPSHTAIQEPDEPLTAGGQVRRRIAVAVSVINPVAKRLCQADTSAAVCAMPQKEDQVLRRSWRRNWLPGLQELGSEGRGVQFLQSKRLLDEIFCPYLTVIIDEFKTFRIHTDGNKPCWHKTIQQRNVASCDG